MSIVDIANEAGVSVSSVSRYFNNPDKIARETSVRIREVVERRGFTPNLRRPGPKTAERVGVKTGVVAFLAMGKESPQMVLKLNAMHVLVESIQDALISRRLTMMMAHLQADGSLPPELSPQTCDGLILYGKPQGGQMSAKLRSQLLSFPAVWCFREHADPLREFDHILYDNNLVGKLAADYFHKRGHQEVAVVNGETEHVAYIDRVKVFSKCCGDHGMRAQIIQPERHTQVADIAVYHELAQRIARAEPRPRALFFCADSLMLGVLNELRVLHFNIAMFDCVGVNNNEELLRYLSPRPATVDIKMYEVGTLAVEYLFKRINQQSDGYRSEIFVKPELIEGDR